MTQQPHDRTVLITGGSSGIGLAMAQQLVADGATVIICGRSQARLDAAQRNVPQLHTIRCDLTQHADREAPINTAAIAHRYLFAPVTDLEAKLTQEWQTNYLAPVLLGRDLLPLLDRNHGTIVNVTTGLVYVPLSIQPNYCATKAALHSMTQSMRHQLAETNVRVVEILYPVVDTPFQQGRAPQHAMSPEAAAAEALAGLQRGKTVIHVGRASLLHWLSRLMPNRALQMVNRVVSEEIKLILARQS